MYRPKSKGPTRTMSVTPKVTDPDMINRRGKADPDHDDLMSELGEPVDMEETIFKKNTTAEEQTSKTDMTVLIIIFALVVIALIAIIIWIMMKDTDKAAEDDVKQMMQRPPPMPPQRRPPQHQRPPQRPAQPKPEEKDEPDTEPPGISQQIPAELPSQPPPTSEPIKLVGLLSSMTADDVLKKTKEALDPVYDERDREILSRKASDDHITIIIQEDDQDTVDGQERVEVLE